MLCNDPLRNPSHGPLWIDRYWSLKLYWPLLTVIDRLLTVIGHFYIYKSKNQSIHDSNKIPNQLGKINLVLVLHYILTRKCYSDIDGTFLVQHLSPTELSITGTSPDFVQSLDFLMSRFLSGTRLQSGPSLDKNQKNFEYLKIENL